MKIKFVNAWKEFYSTTCISKKKKKSPKINNLSLQKTRKSIFNLKLAEE